MEDFKFSLTDKDRIAFLKEETEQLKKENEELKAAFKTVMEWEGDLDYNDAQLKQAYKIGVAATKNILKIAINL